MKNKEFLKKSFPAEIIIPGFIVTALGAIFSILSLSQYDNFLVLSFILLISIIFIIIFPLSAYLSLIVNSGIFGFYFASQTIKIESFPAIYMVDIYLVALLIAMLVHIALGKDIKWQRGRLTLFILIFILFALFSTYKGLVSSGHDASLALGTFRRFLYILFYFPTIHFIKSKKEIKAFFIMIFITSLLAFFFSIWGVINGEGVWTENFPIYGGERYLAAWQAFYTTLGFGIALSFIFLKKKQEIFKMVVIIGLQLITVGLSLFRHLWFAILCLIAVDFALLWKNKKRGFGQNLTLMVSVLTIVVGVGMIFVVLLGRISGSSSILTSFMARISNIISPTEMGSQFRLDLWNLGLQQFYESPILGIGYGGYFASALPGYEEGTYTIMGIHNSYLSILVQMGVMGFLSFIVILGKFIIDFFKKDKFLWETKYGFYALAVINCLVVFIFSGIFGDSWEGSTTAFLGWSLLALYEQVILFSKEEISQSQENLSAMREL